MLKKRFPYQNYVIFINKNLEKNEFLFRSNDINWMPRLIRYANDITQCDNNTITMLVVISQQYQTRRNCNYCHYDKL